MDSITFYDDISKENIEYFVLEETQINGVKYLLVTEDAEEDCDAYILRETGVEGEEVVCEMVEDEDELKAVGKVFAELLDDTDFEF